MADVILSRPAPGVTERISCGPDARFVIEFATEESTVSAQGDDLVFSFDDQGEVRLTGYLKTYTAETAPDLLIGGSAEVDGKEFWNAIFTDDLAPGNSSLQAAFGDHAFSGTDLAMGSMPDMAQTDDPSVLSYMVTMQTTGA